MWQLVGGGGGYIHNPHTDTQIQASHSFHCRGQNTHKLITTPLSDSSTVNSALGYTVLSPILLRYSTLDDRFYSSFCFFCSTLCKLEALLLH
jgi:hypothetical protein